MMVEEIMKGKLGSENDKFPVGLRVLVVDDDMTCLKILENLLKKCLYEVTTCNQAKVALEMLRENRNRFDIIITEVHMPDMDGFKLLELVGLEMDLPVIMLSANSDPKVVMKGIITHGACDYLLKPVRIEELKSIWQHVVRKKIRDSKLENNSESQNRDQQENTESGNGTNSNNSSDQHEEGEENGMDNVEPGTKTKPRLVWSIDLHRKFVAVVNQLGIDGAVSGKILEHINVEGLTRENVASHLQKYRLCLRRMSSVASPSSGLSAGVNGLCMRMSPYNICFDKTAKDRGIRVLVVDSDLNELLLLDDLLRKWQCQVTTATKAKEALEILRENKNSFDFLITEVHTPDMDSIKFLELVGIETNLPIIMLLANTDGDIITNGNTYGACYYLVKPIRHEDLRMMWQHVMSKEIDRKRKVAGSGPKREPRFVWTMDLHSKFVEVVNQLGIEKATPKRVLDLMNVEGLTRKNVATHLQKYRCQPLRANTFALSQNVEWLTGENVASHLEKYNSHLGWIAATANKYNSVPTLGKVGCIAAQELEKASLFQPKENNNIPNNLVVSNGVTSPLSQTSSEDNEWVVKMTDLSLIDKENTSKCTNLQLSGVEKIALDEKMRSNEDYLLEKMESQNDYEPVDDYMNSMIKRDDGGSWKEAFFRIFGKSSTYDKAKLAFLPDYYLQSQHGVKDKVFAKDDFMEKMIEATTSNRACFLLGVAFTVFVFMIMKMF